MAAPLSLRDAAVALRSLPRRYGELVRGLKDDDTWERLARTVGPDQTRSALGWVGVATALVTQLAQAVAALPTQATPKISLRSLQDDSVSYEPAVDRSVDDVLSDLQAATTRAAEAVEARGPDDSNRTVAVDGTDTTLSELLGVVVHGAVGHLRDIQAAVDAARFDR